MRVAKSPVKVAVVPASATRAPVRMGIQPNELVFDDRVQRALRPEYVTKIAKDFDIALVGVITVSVRPNGKWVVLDGQHRCQAMISVGQGDTEIECNVYEKLSVQEEAQLFADLNKHKLKMDPLSYFHVALIAEEGFALKISNILDRYSLRVPKRAQAIDGCVIAIKTLEKIYQYDNGVLLNKCLSALHGAWGTSKKAYDGALLSGLAHFFKTYPDTEKGILEKLKDTVPDKVIAAAKHTKSMSGVSLDEAFLRHFVDLYNRHRKTKKIGV